MTVRIESVENAGAFLESWRWLHAKADAPSFYQSPAWIEAWLAGKPAGVAIYRLEVEEGGAPLLLGVFGLAAHRRPPIIGAREARYLEFGDAVLDAVYVEYNDFLVARGADGGALRRAAAAALFSTLHAADAFVFRNARPALAHAVAEAGEAAGFKARTVNEAPTFQCDLTAARAGGGIFLDTLKGSAEEQIGRSMRLYEERGRLRLAIAESPEERRQAYARIKALHAAAWARRGKPGVYANPALSAFHDLLIAAAPESVSLFLVFAGDEIIGGLHNFIHGDRVLNYQSGFRYEDDNRLKPGLVSHALAAQHYLEAGYTVYDLLAGEARYKRSLGSEGEMLSTVVVERRDLRARLRAGVRRIKALTVRSAKTRRT